MHNISKQSIRKLAHQISSTSDQTNSKELLDKARILYEKAIVLHYQDSLVENNPKETSTPKPVATVDKPVMEEQELSVQERIKQIMDSAPQFESDTVLDLDTTPAKQTLRDEDIKVEEPQVEDPKVKEPEETITMPTQDLEEEFKDAIAADYAADLFEKAEKIEITKKSLNDKLSQAQIQIGLNDRIAFVKHLFNGSQTDFNRVLSQLNSFNSKDQAEQFITTMVKPEYNWSAKSEYEERFMLLIERKFL